MLVCVTPDFVICGSLYSVIIIILIYNICMRTVKEGNKQNLDATFVGRQQELETLNRYWGQERAALLVVYGPICGSSLRTKLSD